MRRRRFPPWPNVGAKSPSAAELRAHPLRSYVPRFAIPQFELGSIPDEELGREQPAGIPESTLPKAGQPPMATMADELQARGRDRLSGM